MKKTITISSVTPETFKPYDLRDATYPYKCIKRNKFGEEYDYRISKEEFETIKEIYNNKSLAILYASTSEEDYIGQRIVSNCAKDFIKGHKLIDNTKWRITQ